MKYLILIIQIFISHVAISGTSVLTPLQINDKATISGDTFTYTFIAPSNTSIKLFIANTSDFNTDNISITTPSGQSITETNASTHDVSYLINEADNGISALVFPIKSWFIDFMQGGVAGEYIVTGTHSGSNPIPITVLFEGSNISSKLYVGDASNLISTDKHIPLTLYLIEGSSHFTSGTVTFSISKDGQEIYSKTAVDDGENNDIHPDDGLYTAFVLLENPGMYNLVAEYQGTNSIGEQFQGRLAKTFNVKTITTDISPDYVESTTDLDSDGLKDELILTFPFNGTFEENDYYYIYGKLKVGTEYLVSTEKITFDDNQFQLKFKGFDIRKIGYSGQFNLELVRIDRNGRYYKHFDNLKDTAAYNFDEWERDELEYSDGYRYEYIDEDNNNIFEGMRFFFEIDSVTAGTYGYSFSIRTEDNIDIALLGSNPTELSAGLNTLETTLSAGDITSHGFESALIIENLLIHSSGESKGFLKLDNIGTTEVINCWDFAGCENGPNNAPEAIDDFSSSNGSSIYINAASNDIDADGDLIKVNSVTQPQNGVAEIVGNSVHYTPNEGFMGDDVFTYEILDVYPKNNVWKRGSDIGTITVSVTNNLPPVANDDTYAIPVNGESQLTVLENDSDPDGDNLYITETTSPQNGTVTNYGNIIVYKAIDGFEGQDSFQYTIIDVDPETNIAKDGTDSAVVTLNVGAVSNSPPVANDDEYTVNAGVETTLDIVANDSDPDGDNVYVVEYTLPNEGTLEFVDNKAVYTAYADSMGFDGFKYTITDTKGGYSEANVLINIVSDSTNYPPVANDDYASTLTNTTVTIPVLENDTDPENDPLSIVSVSSPSNGDATISNGQVEYTPALDFMGEDIFSYTVTDGNGNESTASVFVTVNQTNSPPIAHDDSAITQVNQSVSIDVLSNDEDPDNDTLTITSIADPSSGTAEASGNNIIYTPDTDYVGNDSFTYTISDGKAQSTATVAIAVEDTNVAPIAENDSASVIQGGMITLDVLQNDSDSNGDVLNIIDVTQPDYGEATIENNKIKYVSDSSYVGEVSFSYTISDGVLTANANIVINIEEKIDTAPSIQILAPENGDNYASNINIILMAEAIDNEDGLLENILWESSIDGALGSGSEITVNLSPGQHLITASVTDSSDNSSSSTVNITVSQSSGTEYRNDNDYNIPDNKGYGVSSNINITNSHLAHGIEVRATISHASESDIAVQLIAPSGKHYNLSNPGSYNRDEIWNIEFKSEIDIKGTWTLKVSDQKLNVTGSLLSWSVKAE